MRRQYRVTARARARRRQSWRWTSAIYGVNEVEKALALGGLFHPRRWCGVIGGLVVGDDAERLRELLAEFILDEATPTLSVTLYYGIQWPHPSEVVEGIWGRCAGGDALWAKVTQERQCAFVLVLLPHRGWQRRGARGGGGRFRNRGWQRDHESVSFLGLFGHCCHRFPLRFGARYIIMVALSFCETALPLN